MVLYGTAFPEKNLCVLTVGEERAAYQAALEARFARSKALYAVQGIPPEALTRQDVEAHYGAEVLRMEVLNEALVYQYPALQAQVCAAHGLVPLGEPQPHLLEESDDGYRLEVRFYTVPRVALRGYTGLALPAAGDGLANAAAAHAAAQSGFALPQSLVDAMAADQKESMVQRIRQQIDGTAGQIKKAEGQGLGGETGPLRARKAALEQLLRQAEAGDEVFAQKLLAAVQTDLYTVIGLYNVAWQENLTATTAEVEAEIDRMVAISPQNAYARQSLAARQSIARRLTLQKTRAWLCAHNRTEAPAQA